MTRREQTRQGIQSIAAYAFMTFNSWGFIQIESKSRKETNSFLNVSEAALKQAFFLAVANFFDETKGVLSIKSYLKLLSKSPKEDDKKVLKSINSIIEKNKEEIRLLIKRRGVDLAHINEEIAFNIFQKKRGQKYEEVVITGKQVIDLLGIIEKIVNIIESHELGGQTNLKVKLHTAMSKDYKKVFKG